MKASLLLVLMVVPLIACHGIHSASFTSYDPNEAPPVIGAKSCVNTPSASQSPICNAPTKDLTSDFSWYNDDFIKRMNQTWNEGNAETAGSLAFCEKNRASCMNATTEERNAHVAQVCQALSCAPSKQADCQKKLLSLGNAICGKECVFPYDTKYCTTLTKKYKDGGETCSTDTECTLRYCYTSYCWDWCNTQEQCDGWIAENLVARKGDTNCRTVQWDVGFDLGTKVTNSAPAMGGIFMFIMIIASVLMM